MHQHDANERTAIQLYHSSIRQQNAAVQFKLEGDDECIDDLGAKICRRVLLSALHSVHATAPRASCMPQARVLPRVRQASTRMHILMRAPMGIFFAFDDDHQRTLCGRGVTARSAVPRQVPVAARSVVL